MDYKLIFEACGSPAQIRRSLAERGIQIAIATPYRWREVGSIPVDYLPALADVAHANGKQIDFNKVFSCQKVGCYP